MCKANYKMYRLLETFFVKFFHVFPMFTILNFANVDKGPYKNMLNEYFLENKFHCQSHIIPNVN